MIVIIEGAWAVGKTNLCNDLSTHHESCFYIPEPYASNILNHLDRANWYLSEHFKRINHALERATQYDLVLLERGPISSLAYNYKLLGDRKNEIMNASTGEDIHYIVFTTKSTVSRIENKARFGEASDMLVKAKEERYLKHLSYLVTESSGCRSLFLENPYHYGRDFHMIQSFLKR